MMAVNGCMNLGSIVSKFIELAGRGSRVAARGSRLAARGSRRVVRSHNNPLYSETEAAAREPRATSREPRPAGLLLLLLLLLSYPYDSGVMAARPGDLQTSVRSSDWWTDRRIQTGGHNPWVGRIGEEEEQEQEQARGSRLAARGSRAAAPVSE